MDELERICTTAQTLPGRLELTIEGQDRSWSTPEERRPFYRELREALAPVDGPARDELLAEIARWSGMPALGGTEAMTADQLRRLADGDLLEIGAHTVSHPSLPGLPKHRQLEEIRESRERLTDLVGRDVRLFSYPFGAYDRSSVESAREAGVSCACTTVEDGVRASTDPYRLPRLYVGDWPADELVAAIEARVR